MNIIYLCLCLRARIALCIWNVCLVSDICIRLWAVIGARREPYCPARCELIFVTAVFILLGEINDDDDDDDIGARPGPLEIN